MEELIIIFKKLFLKIIYKNNGGGKMKKLFSILLLGLVLFAFTSCADDSNGGSSNSGFPTIPQDEDWEWSDFGFEQVIFFYSQSYYAGVELLSYEEPEEWEFRLNGEEIDIEWEYDWEQREDEVWWAEVDEEDLPEEVDLSSGSTVSYYLKVNNTTSSGELTIPYQIYVNWDEFAFDEDFVFDWDIQQNPSIHYVFMYFDCEIDTNYVWIEKNWQLSGSQRNYSISKNLYQQYENCYDYWFNTSLDAINFRNTGKCLALADSWDSYSTYNYRGEEKPDKKERMKRIFEAFKNNSQ